MTRKILFIINPRSGKKNSSEIIEIIKKNIPKTLDYQIGLWNTIEEFNTLKDKLLKENFTDAVAVGGDGSVNLTGRAVLGSGLTLGIIPAGSGNGLARTLGISTKYEEALKQLIENKTQIIDHGMVNDIPFFCTSGVGFDAHIGNLFANTKKRGLKTYIKMVITEFFNYKPQQYVLKLNGQSIERTAFFITVANAGQFGNNFYIAPQAKLNDGLFHVVVFKPFSLLAGLTIVLKILRGKAHESKYVETFTTNSLTVIREKSDSVHYDGEPQTLGVELKYTNYPNSLKVIVGQKFEGINAGPFQ